MTKILIADDEQDIIEFLSYNLEKEGYEVITALNGHDAVKKALDELPDLIILDIMMPGMDGIEVCQYLKENPKLKSTSIVFLTARGEDYSQIAGFDAGADDYILKPIKPKVFSARLKALINRTKKPVLMESQVSISHITIDHEKRIVYCRSVPIELPRKEYELFSFLFSKPGKVFTREELYKKIWGSDVIVSEGTLDVYIHKIREKIDNKCIKTLKGIGYKFEL